MNRIGYIMVLCLSTLCYNVAIGQLRPQKTAEQFFLRKLLEEKASLDFSFGKPIQRGNIWIFECKDRAGFVLVQESDTCRVVGYSTGNRFARNNEIPPPALSLLESLSNCPDSEFKSPPVKTGYNPIGPMIRSTWSQEGYFNYFCPEDPDGPDFHVYAGCVAVAMGQILRYYGKFNDFLVSAVSEDSRYGILTATIGNYDWSRMENRPITIDTEVSQLLFGLGVLTRMDYGPSGSSSSNFNVYDSFKKLKYYTATRMVRGTTTPEVWAKIFHQNIADFQPIYVSGSGHSLVCDGIDSEGLFHFNLGWYGYADGYYPLNQIFSINPAEAIFDLRPYSNNLPPANLMLDTLSDQHLIRWEKHRLAGTDPILYKVYLNDTLSYETRETWINPSYFPAGNHEIMITAVYPAGESSWIGPIRLPIAGHAVNIPDIALKIAIQEELIRENIKPVLEFPTINQLLKINRLEIRQPVTSLAGLEYCHNIQLLTIASEENASLNLGPVSLLKRLKWLDLVNIESTSLDLVARNDRLIHLDLTHCMAQDLTFLSELTGLLNLKLSDLPITNTQIFNNMQSIRELTLSGCNLSNAGFIQNMNKLEYIDLSRNQLQRIRLTEKLPKLRVLDINHNQINELYFLEQITNINTLNLGNNQINRFITGLNFKNLRELHLENNLIDSIWIGVPMNSLLNLSITGNKIRDISLLKDFAPGLISLESANNLIPNFWTGSLQKLEYVNLSNNRINLINDIPANPSLKHIDLSYNRLADLYPLFDHNNSMNIEFLDMTGNPLSIESAEDFALFLSTVIDTFLIPDIPQVFSPGKPGPARNQTITGQAANLSWMSETLPLNGFYEIYTGLSPKEINLAGQTGITAFPVDITAGQQYYWRVRTVLPDTSYFSGLFNFSTNRPISLPFKEDFESYPAFSYFSQLSEFWIRSDAGTASNTDGRIDPYRKSEGKQSLKLTNLSDLRLPLKHLYQSVLYVSMQLLIEKGCIASVQLNNISDTGLKLFFKSNGRCDILINNELIQEIPFLTSEWIPLQINLYGKGGDIWLRLGGTDIQIPWIFTGNTTNPDELELASTTGPNWPTDGQPLFHVDNLEIKASGSLATESIPSGTEILVYPNPAAGSVNVEIPDLVSQPEITLFDYSGRVVRMDLSADGIGKWRMNVSDLEPGIYLIRVATGKEIKTGKILVSPGR